MATSISGISFNGLASGIDTATIISKLTQLGETRLQVLQARKAGVATVQAAFGGIQAKLLDLQSQVGRLARSIGGAFEARTATSSDESVLTAAAGAGTSTGTLSLQVQTLAQAHQLASNGVADPATTIQQGTVQIHVGNGATTTVTIDGTNNTLQGLANAINASGGDVRASIVNDGSATPYKLLLSSTKTGAANTIQITNNLTGTGTAIDLSAQTVQAAGDASVKVGSGAGAITVTSATNQIENLIAGVTIKLTKAAPTQTVTVSVSNDTAGANKSIHDFVDAYNVVVGFIGDRNQFNAATQQAGLLLGNADAASVINELATSISSSVGGVNALANRLSAIGVTVSDNGKLAVNDTKLDQALTGQVAGVTIGDFRRLFALTGTSTSAGVSFLLGGDRTKPSGASPYQVNITQAATSAQISAGVALTDPIKVETGLNEFTIKVDGVTSSLISLDLGTYTQAEFAAAVQTKINADPNLTSHHVAVDLDGGNLRVRSLAIGSLSQVSFVSGSALGASGPLGFSGSEASTGLNVAGNFIVNGQIETATGFGQVLTGSSGNTNTDGLQVRVTLTQDQVVAGPEADVGVTQGLAARLNKTINRFLDPVTGRLKTVDDRFKKDTSGIDNIIKRQNALLERKKDQLLIQFAAMEASISRIKSLGDQLTASFGTTCTA